MDENRMRHSWPTMRRMGEIQSTKPGDRSHTRIYRFFVDFCTDKISCAHFKLFIYLNLHLYEYCVCVDGRFVKQLFDNVCVCVESECNKHCRNEAKEKQCVISALCFSGVLKWISIIALAMTSKWKKSIFIARCYRCCRYTTLF